MKQWLFLLTLLLAAPLAGAVDVHEFETEEQRERFQQLGEQLRCPKCQNQSIGDSDAEISQDMRAKTAQLIREGKSNEEIIEYFVARYGQFVDYRPPFQPETLLLWTGPVLIFLFGVVFIVRLLRRATRVTGEDE